MAQPREQMSTALFVFGASTVVAIPLGLTIIFGFASVGGCFLECSEPDPGAGIRYFLAAMALLAVPVLVGFAARRRSRTFWLWGWAALIVGLGIPFAGFN
ncbi:hypothetical protein J2S48_003198 [Promicromonospora iranensis]|uniref:Uncharacterized protein n=1 Tax=Promicromonospora iranensis TaxID=1105144 RepID=A0ABU2CQR9_9MICO|nr:hypothetical protein [Promicromonospora iranensis]